MVNETMARKLWPDRRPSASGSASGAMATGSEVVGVVRDGKYLMLGEEPRPYFYVPLVAAATVRPSR